MRSVELFAGAGGLGMGVGRAGFHHAAVVEIDRHCVGTIDANRGARQPDVAPWPDVFMGDVRRFDYLPLEDKVALVSGGPPCQPFSVGGRHRAHADRRDMFPEAVRALRELRPKAFIFENVKGLTRDRFTNYVEYIQLQMTYPELTAGVDEDWHDHLRRLERHHTARGGREAGLEYRVVREVLNAANYGVPQKRERVFFVGFRADTGIAWSFPDPTHSQEALAWAQRPGGDYWERHGVRPPTDGLSARIRAKQERLTERPATQPWYTVRDALIGLPKPDHRHVRSGFANHLHQPGARSYPGHTGSHEDEPAKTLKAGVHGVPGGENMIRHAADGSVRYFTVRESARLQTFPDDYVFSGCWSEAMRQLGNAVPVKLAEIVARSVKGALDGAGVLHS